MMTLSVLAGQMLSGSLLNFDFPAFFRSRAELANWGELAAILAVGLVLAVFLFAQRSFTCRCVGWNCLVSTVLLLLGLFLGSSILSYIAFGLLVATVILYQPELREVMIKVTGARSIASGRRTVATLDAHHSAIDAICQATVELSRNKTGALIVLERRIKLDDVARSGVELDANTNPYLLRNIFYDKAPLHDGAVIIRNCRVWAAGCILPLTARNDVDQDLGTRHRAAIGLSEICDAIVIVVSEESGIISLAYQSELTRDYSFQSLHAFLTKNLLHENEEESKAD